MFEGALERRDVSASNAFGFSKKYPNSRKCEMIFDRNVKSSLAFFQMQNVELCSELQMPDSQMLSGDCCACILYSHGGRKFSARIQTS